MLDDLRVRLRDPFKGLGRPSRTSTVWISLALLYPLALTWLYFIALADVPAPWPQLAYGVGKAVQFGPALWWLARVRPDLVRPRARTTRRDLAVGAAFGTAVALALFAVYAGRPFDLLGPSGHAAFAAAASDKAGALGIASPVRFLVLGMFYALLHSGLEEAYWRGLVFTTVRDRTRARTAVWVSSIAFTLHHIVLVTTLLPGQLPLALLLAACVGIGGAAWSVQRSVSRSLLGAWLGHGIVDAAIFAVGGWVLFGGGADGGPAAVGSPTPRPITWASPYPSATLGPITPPSPQPSATPGPSATPSPWPTKTALPTVDASVPLPVAMTLGEARAEVLSWLDPDHAPRIVSVDYIPGASVATSDYESPPVVYDYFGGWTEEHWLEAGMPSTVVRVVGETDVLESRDLSLGLSLGGGADERTVEKPEVERSQFLALFDASSGIRLAAMPQHHGGDVWISALAAPTAALTYTVPAVPLTATPARSPDSPTWTPTAVPTPIGSPVDAGSVPVELHEVLSAYPLLPRSTWTWDSTTWEGDVSWTRSRITETVMAAWQEDERHVIVRSVVVRARVFGTGRIDAEGVGVDVWRSVGADGHVNPYAVTRRDFEPSNDIGFRELSGPAAARLGLPLEALLQPHVATEWSFADEATSEHFAVTTPAGRFDDCGKFDVIGGAAFGSVRAICRGVGYVQTNSWHGGVHGFQRTVMWLVSYDVVLPR